MRFFEIVISGAALLSSVLAVEFNDVPKSIEPGKTYTVTYSPKDNTPTTIKLRQGDPNNLATLATITTTAVGGSFQWTVPANLPNAPNYALEIQQGTGNPNYSGLIPLTGSAVSASASASASTSASASPSSSGSKTSSATSSSAASSTTGSTMTTSASSVSGSPTPSSNGTLSSTSRTPSASGSATRSGNSPPQATTNSAGMLASTPIALIMGVIAAMAYLN